MFPTTMPLMTLIWQQHRFAFIKVILLNLLNALVNVAIIAFINRFLIAAVGTDNPLLGSCLLYTSPSPRDS